MIENNNNNNNNALRFMRPEPVQKTDIREQRVRDFLWGWPVAASATLPVFSPSHFWRHHERLHESLVCGLPCSAVWLHPVQP